MRIGFLTSYYPRIGGVEVMASRLAEQLAGRGEEVHFISYPQSEELKHMKKRGIKLHKAGEIHFHAFPSQFYTWTLASKVIDVDREYNLDLIHVHYAIPFAAAAFLAKEALKKQDGKKLPYVVSLHGSDVHTNGNHKSLTPVLKLAVEEANAVTYVSEDLRRIARNDLDVSNGEVVSNFVDTNRYRRKDGVEILKLRKKLGYNPNDKIVVHASNFPPIKRVHLISDVADIILKERKDIHFLLAGDGPEKASLEQRVLERGHSNNFKFLGMRGNMEDVYNVGDVTVLPSQMEGCPLVMLESMACGTPVIATNVGGIPEVIEDGKNGFLFNLDDIQRFKKCITGVVDNPKLKEEMGREAEKRVRENHSIEEIMERYYKIYSKALNGSSQ